MENLRFALKTSVYRNNLYRYIVKLKPMCTVHYMKIIACDVVIANDTSVLHENNSMRSCYCRCLIYHVIVILVVCEVVIADVYDISRDSNTSSM